MSNREQMFRLNLEFLKSKYEIWDENHSEELTLFQIIEYGDLEPIHTMFLNWLLRPAYHKKTYQNKYVREFLKRNGIETNSNDKIIVRTEETSSSIIENKEEDQQRRADIWIEVHGNKSKRTIIVENKINDMLGHEQVVQEMKQYLGNNKGDVYIALLLDSNRYQFENLEKNPIVEKTLKNKDIIFRLFTYSNWLELNKEFDEHFGEIEKRKIQHLNENIWRLVKMEEISDFNEDYKIYLNSYTAINHYKEKYREQIEIFLNHLIKKYQKLFGSKAKVRMKDRMVGFDLKGYDVEIWCTDEYLPNNMISFGILLPENSNKRDHLIKKLEPFFIGHEKGYRDTNKEDKIWEFFDAKVNPLDHKELEKDIINKINEMEKILS